MSNLDRQISIDDTEWKSCLEQINKFDGYLNELRKYGFTLITGLITASSFLGFSTGNNLIHVGVIMVTMILIMVLFWIDRYYQKINIKVYFRGRFLEIILERGLISTLSNLKFSGRVSHRLGSISLIYMGFIIALGALAFFAYYNEINSEQNNHKSLEQPPNSSQAVYGFKIIQPYNIPQYEFTQESVPIAIPELLSIEGLVYIGITVVSGILSMVILLFDISLQADLKRLNFSVESIFAEHSETIHKYNEKLSSLISKANSKEEHLKYIKEEIFSMEDILRRMDAKIRSDYYDKENNEVKVIRENLNWLIQDQTNVIRELHTIFFQIDEISVIRENTIKKAEKSLMELVVKENNV